MWFRYLSMILLLLPMAVNLHADKLPTGEELLAAWGCRSCHRIGTFGGSTASDLSRVGQRLKAVDIRRRLHPPADGSRDSLMPSFPEMSKSEVRILADYLAGLK